MWEFVLKYLTFVRAPKNVGTLLWSVCPSFRLERNGQVHFAVPISATFTKLAPTVHLDMIYWYHVIVSVLDLHFTLEWPWLGRNGYVYITVPIGATFTKFTPTVHLDMIYLCHVVVRKKWSSLFTKPMSATFTKLTSTVHLDMIYWCHVVVCVLDLHFTLQWSRHKMAIAGSLWWFPSQ